MGRIAYSRAQMAEAVVLAAIVGADAASSRLGMGAKAIRRWSERAGTVPADSIGQADWEHLGALAKAQVQSDLLAGRLTTVQAATVAGIAQRHAAKPEPVAEPPTPAE
jgi:hypothetical protein